MGISWSQVELKGPELSRQLSWIRRQPCQNVLQVAFIMRHIRTIALPRPQHELIWSHFHIMLAPLQAPRACSTNHVVPSLE